VKIKDIINEQGFWSSFGKALLPSALRKVADADQPTGDPGEIALAQKAQKMFGDNPESPLPGFMSWMSPKQQMDLVNQKAKEKKDAERKAAMQAAATQAQEKEKALTRKQSKGLQNLVRDIKQGKAPGDLATASDIPTGQRIRVTNPQGNATFYKYPGGKWTDEFGTAMPRSAHGALDQFADSGGRMEQIPAATKTAYQGRGGRRGR